MQRYQWLLFDADGTLFDFEHAEGKALQQAFGQLGVTFDPGYLAIYQRINLALWAAVERGEIKPVVVKIKRFEMLLEAIGGGGSAAELGARCLECLAACSELIADANAPRFFAIGSGGFLQSRGSSQRGPP